MFLTTSYSFRRAYGSIPDVLDAAYAKGYKCAPIADYASTWGFVEWKREAEKRDMRPVFGVKIAVSPNVSAKKPVVDYWTFVAKDDLEPLNRLVTLANSQFRYQPIISYKQAMEAQGLFKIAGHAALFDEFETCDDLFVGLSPACAKGFVRHAIGHGHKFCAMQNQRFVSPEDAGIYEMVCGRNGGSQTYPQHIIDFNEWFQFLFERGIVEPEELHDALTNFEVICDSSTATLQTADIIRVKPEKTLREMCLDGVAKRGITLDEVYKARLDEEISVIEGKNFQDYFFVVADMMQFARANMLCGPGRGSSAGSLVCYLLEITDVDPIKYDLLFFRFIDVNRQDWPDIDSDIDSEKREILFDYLREKYGADRFAQVGALAYFQTKNALNEICKALSIPRYELNALESRVEGFAANDDRKLTALSEALDKDARISAKYPELAEAIKVIGQPTHSSAHAGGIVISSESLYRVTATAPEKKSERPVLQLSKDDAESLGFVKIDALGLKNLAIYDEALRQAGLPMNVLSKLSYNDQAVFDTLNDGKFIGVFQFEGDALRRLTRDVKVTSLDDLAIISSLARPGPLSSGAAQRWVDKRNGKRPIGYPHNLLKPYLEKTSGELVFQEQIMLIAREVAGLDWSIVSRMRKAIAKSQGEAALAEYGEPFMQGLEKAGIESEIAQSIWREIVGFGAYSFNAAHAYAYAMVTYWSLWLKTYHPLEYAAASLTFREKIETQRELLRELDAEGVKYTPVDPENSTDKWRVVNGRLIGPLTAVRGLGPKMVQTILSCRARGEPIPDRAQKLLSDATTEIDSLMPIADALQKAGLCGKSYAADVVPIENVQPNGEWQRDVCIAGLVTKLEIRDENEDRRIQDRLSHGREGRMEGQTKFLEMRVRDDTGEFYVKIGRKEFDNRAQSMIDNINVGETLVCCVGTVPPEICMMLNEKVWKIA